MPDALAIVGVTFNGIFAAVRLAQFAIAIKDVPEAAQTFVRLVERVEKDLEHALSCRIDCDAVLDNSPPSYEEWISETINDTLGALDSLGKLLLRETKEDPALKKTSTPSQKSTLQGQHQDGIVRDQLGERFLFVLRDHAKLKDQERSLRYSHASLLTAISAMHSMIFQGGETKFGLGRVTRAASRPKWSSSQPPSIRRLDLSYTASYDAAPPYSQNDPLSVGTGEAGVQTAQINLERLRSFRSGRPISG